MGQLLSCHCAHCDYSKMHLHLGYGMTEGHCYFPAYNSRNKSVVNLDIYDYLKEEEAPRIDEENSELEKFHAARKAPYFLQTMFKTGNPDLKILFEYPHLQSKDNFCPKCKSYELSFEEIGLFD